MRPLHFKTTINPTQMFIVYRGSTVIGFQINKKD